MAKTPDFYYYVCSQYMEKPNYKKIAREVRAMWQTHLTIKYPSILRFISHNRAISKSNCSFTEMD
jgi:hypothetical protein